MGKQVARTADFAVRVFSVAIIATVPYSIALSKLRRPLLTDRYFFIVVRLFRSARTNLIAPSRGRKDADHKSGGPRYPLPNVSLEVPAMSSVFKSVACAVLFCAVGFAQSNDPQENLKPGQTASEINSCKYLVVVDFTSDPLGIAKELRVQARSQADLPRAREQRFTANYLRLKNLPSDNG